MPQKQISKKIKRCFHEHIPAQNNTGLDYTFKENLI